MKSTILMKSLLASAIYRPGLSFGLFRAAARGDSIVLMYHRLLPKREAQNRIQPGMYVDPNTFASHLRTLRKYFLIRSIWDIFSAKDIPSSSNHKPTCALTFDDGWVDFYTNCFPVLMTEKVPGMVFLPTDFIGSENLFWTDRLSSLLYQRWKRGKAWASESKEEKSISPTTRSLLGLKGSFENRLESAIALLKNRILEEIERTIQEISLMWEIEPQVPGRAFLSWEEVEQRGQTGLISFGSHTATHRILTQLPKEEIEEELKKSKEELIRRKIVDPSYIAFSYPNGNFNEEICHLVRKAGYRLAVTTKRDWNPRGGDLFHLKRVPIHQDMTSTPAMLACRILGFL